MNPDGNQCPHPGAAVAARPFVLTLRFYEELNDFLPPDRRKRAFTVESREPRSVKDLVESLGVPHPEVDLILVDGESVSFEHLLDRDARVTVYPTFETLDIAPVSRLGRPPLRENRFVADVHLGRLARLLRMLGFDCLYNRDWDDAVLAERSAAEERVLLTRDRGLLKRAIVTHGIFLRSDDPRAQLRQVVRRLDLRRNARPFARCIRCNGLLQKVAKADVRDRVPPRTFRYVHRYLRCDTCGRVYWKGTHWDRLNLLVRDALQAPDEPTENALD